MIRSTDKYSEPYLKWPGWDYLRFTVFVGVFWTMCFYIFYGGASFATDLHDLRFSWFFEFEKHIPFITEMAVFYFLLIPGIMLSPFIIRQRHAYLHYSARLIFQIVIAAAFFLMLPLADGFPVTPPEGIVRPVFQLADKLNLDHNYFPSVHVSYALTTAQVYGWRTPSFGLRCAIYSMAGLVIVATLFTHQHHLIDIMGGVVLALVIDDRMTDRVCGNIIRRFIPVTENNLVIE